MKTNDLASSFFPDGAHPGLVNRFDEEMAATPYPRRQPDEPAVTADLEALVQRPFIKTLMDRVTAFQEKEFGGNAAIDWKVGTYYTGVFAAYLATKEPSYRDAAHAWGQKANWRIGSRPFYADDICMGQTMLDLYLAEKNPVYIEELTRLLEAYFTREKVTADEVHCHAYPPATELEMTGRNLWWWCDALYMAPPVLVRMHAATKDQRYLDLLHKFYWDTVAHLFDEKSSLIYRDKGFFPKDRATALENEKIFWSRGNGWVYAGLVRVLDYLPENDPQRGRYLELFRTLTRKLVTLQYPDGLWRAWLNRTDLDQTPEVSGTCFFAYGLLAGIRRGWLDKKSYLPVALRAWRGLVGKLGTNGKLGFAQIVDSAPNPVRPESSIDYTHGAFLLAAGELYSLNLSLADLTSVELAEQPRLMLADAAWSSHNDARAVIADQHVYLGGVDAAGLTKFYAYRLNPPNAPAIQRDCASFGTRGGSDDRGSPAFLRFDDTLLAVYAKNEGTASWHWRIASIARELPGWGALKIEWSEEKTFSAKAGGITTLALVRLTAEAGRVYHFYRATDGAYVAWSDDGAQSWQPAVRFLGANCEVSLFDLRVMGNGRDRIDVVCVADKVGTAGGGFGHIYYHGGAFHASAGKVVRSMADAARQALTLEDATPVCAGAETLRGVSTEGISFDRLGQARVVFTVATADAAVSGLRYVLARWSLERAHWTVQPLAYAGSAVTRTAPCGMGGIAFDPAHDRVVYVSTNVEPATGAPNATGRFQLYRGTADETGERYTWEPLTFDAARDNLYPYVPLRQGAAPCVVWQRGTYRSPMAYQTDLYGLGV